MAPRFEDVESSWPDGSDEAATIGLRECEHGLVIDDPGATAYVIVAKDGEDLWQLATRIQLLAATLDQDNPDPRNDGDVMRDLHTHALGLHVASLRWTNGAFGKQMALCWVLGCSDKLTDTQILAPELRGYCPRCAKRQGFPFLPPF